MEEMLSDIQKKIEEDFDSDIIKRYEENVQNKDIEFSDHEDVKKMLGLQNVL